MPQRCPLCKHSNIVDIQTDAARNTSNVDCPNCGRFTITAEATQKVGNDAWKVAAFVRGQTLNGLHPTVYSSEILVPPDARPGSFGIDAALATFPEHVSARLDAALLRLAKLTSHPGASIDCDAEHVNPLLLARNSVEASFTLKCLQEAGLLHGVINQYPTAVSLTAKGLLRTADLQRGAMSAHSNQVFVAMCFHPQLRQAWESGIELGIRDCGYTALRVDAKEHNEKICDMVVAEIRKSKFMVADFTKHRGGVYFEAGFMLGLGRPVIFTCRENHIKRAHFDTRQYNHITWQEPHELRERLKRRIQATIPL